MATMSAEHEPDAGGGEVPFERELERLEAIVERLEGDDLGLEEGVDLYKEGVELLARLNGVLARAETRVEELTRTLEGELAALEAGDGADADAD